MDNSESVAVILCGLTQGSFSLVVDVRHDLSQQLQLPGTRRTFRRIAALIIQRVCMLNANRINHFFAL